MKCLVTELFNDAGIKALEAKGVEVTLAYGKSQEELKAMLPDYDALIVRAATPVKKDMIDAGKKLKSIGMAGIGLNHIDVEYAKSKGIKVLNVPDGSTEAVAELALAVALSVMRKVVAADKAVRANKWDKTGFTGNEIRGKVVGIIALGKIGYRVAELYKAFGATIVTYDPYLKQEIADKIGAKILPLDEVFKQADIVSVHSPLTPETKHMIGKKQLDLMKKGSFVFNLGRGGVVDEDALYDALVSGQLAGAGADVMEVEPPVGSKLLGLDNFVVTCHIGAGSHEAQIYIGESLAKQTLEVLGL